MNVLSVLRDERYSPNSVDKDRQIMMSVVQTLRSAGHNVELLAESEMQIASRSKSSYDLCLSMARMPSALNILKDMEREGVVVLNSPSGVENCIRKNIDAVMRAHGFAMTPIHGNHGWWLKRGDAAAQTAGDVVYCSQPYDVEKARRSFFSRGIRDIVVSAHIEGDLVKFYGVDETDFFHTIYPTAVGISKFGAEEVNGQPHYHPFDRLLLRHEAQRLSRLVSTPIYGGDCIVDEGGRIYIIDFNDWPSYSSCRAEASQAIVRLAFSRFSRNKREIIKQV